MNIERRVARRARAIEGLAAAAIIIMTVPAAAADWPLLAPADLALTQPRVDPNADAEVLLWDVRLTDSDELDDVATILEHHLRIKIFTDRGREAHGKVDLTYVNGTRVRDVQGRTIAPNGTITELRGQDIFDRTIIEADGLKLRSKSFVLPAVVSGSVIEYKWREIRDGELANDLELPFYREIPVHLVRYHIKPLDVRAIGYQMRTQGYNLQAAPEFKKEERGYSGIELRNVPALRREPFMPPSLSLGPWMLVYYADLATADRPVERFWNDFGRRAFGVYKPQIRVTAPIRTTAAEVTKTADSTDEKVDALLKFVRAKIARDDVAGAAPSRRKENKNAAEALARGEGSGADVVMLFTALAHAAGLEARLALLPDRSDFISQPGMKQPYFIRHLAVAVRNDGGWRFVDASSRHAKGGHLSWEHEGQYALLLDEKTPEFVDVATASPAQSVRKRTAALKLLEDGTLEGDVALEYTGQIAVQRRENVEDESPQERERLFTEEIVNRLPTAELSGFTIDNADDAEAPYVVRFRLRVPGYGQRTGSRLFVQPAVMQRGAEALFTDSTRRHHVYFPYAWSEQDTVTIELPDGYIAEEAAGPAVFGLGQGSTLYSPKVQMAADGRRVNYTRSLFVGAQGNILFRPDDYKEVKSFFSEVQRHDGFTIALRRRTAADQR
jgi:transglutaminase-like putative cysteine protease